MEESKKISVHASSGIPTAYVNLSPPSRWGRVKRWAKRNEGELRFIAREALRVVSERLSDWLQRGGLWKSRKSALSVPNGRN